MESYHRACYSVRSLNVPPALPSHICVKVGTTDFEKDRGPGGNCSATGCNTVQKTKMSVGCSFDSPELTAMCTKENITHGSILVSRNISK